MAPSIWIFDLTTRNLTPSQKKHKVGAKYYSQLSSSEKDQSSVPVKKSAKPQQAPEHDQHQDSTDSVLYRGVDMSDLPSQYAQ